MKVLLSDVENLRHVRDLADGENTAKGLIDSLVFLDGIDE